MKAYRLGSFLAATALVSVSPAAYGQRVRRAVVNIQSTPPGATVRVLNEFLRDQGKFQEVTSDT